jgi:uncharacterized repeat protein (TIGR03843 family)
VTASNATGVTGAADPRRDVLLRGDLSPVGRIRSASNATFLCEATLGETTLACVYKPVAGEQPLWDFPDGTLAGRELASYLISAALRWDIVPHTIIRDGPAGDGMVQLWVEQRNEPEDAGLVDLCPSGSVPPGYIPIVTAYDYSGGEVTLVHADDPQLRRMALFDVVVNNADRKGGHILAGTDGRVYGVDHGVCLHAHDKLRTVLWGWAGEKIADADVAAHADLERQLDDRLGARLREQITAGEVAALRRRVRHLLDDPVMPSPNGHRPLPWPAF